MVKLHERAQQRLEFAQRDHVRAVGRRVVRVLMRLDENARDADRDRGTREHRNIFALTA